MSELQSICAEVTSIAADIASMAQRLQAEARNLRQAAGVTQGGSTTHLSAQEFAQVLRQSGWQGQPVRLFSCNTGCDPKGFAQQLANELGVPVTAPDAPVWTDGSVTDEEYIIVNGQPRPRPIKPNTGDWHVFTPQ